MDNFTDSNTLVLSKLFQLYSRNLTLSQELLIIKNISQVMGGSPRHVAQLRAFLVQPRLLPSLVIRFILSL